MPPQETKTPSVNRIRQGLTVTLSPIALAGSLAVLCAGFILIFALGVMLGRGHNLESNIPELEAIMPERGQPITPVVIDGGEERAGHVVTVFEGSASGEPVRAEVIPQGDLEYREHLKKTTPSRRVAPDKDDAAGKNTAKPQNDEKKTAPAKKPDNTAPAKGAPELKPLDIPIAPVDAKRYQFVYQVASSRDQAASEAYAAKLKAGGLSAHSEKSESGESVWYRTIVEFSGTTAEAEAFRERMKGYGIDQPLLKSKK